MSRISDPNTLSYKLDRATLDQETRKALASRLRFYRELGIYDFYRRDVSPELIAKLERGTTMSEAAGETASNAQLPASTQQIVQLAEAGILDKSEALNIIRQEIGAECRRCKLSGLGRKQVVFGDGSPDARIMFIGEGPGADEDEQGIPFVGRAGQLLNNMISAMGLKREDVYIANVVKCRPPGNRTPERDECETCSPFLLRQIDVVGPEAIVALGAVAARNLLQVNETMVNMRGRWHEFRGRKLRVTYHPAYLLRDPNQKKEAWKDLQAVMAELGLKAPGKTS